MLIFRSDKVYHTLAPT